MLDVDMGTCSQKVCCIALQPKVLSHIKSCSLIEVIPFSGEIQFAQDADPMLR